MKCPVCDKVNTSMLCPQCGFDSSGNCERYPTFGPAGRGRSTAALRQEWMQKHQMGPVFETAPRLDSTSKAQLAAMERKKRTIPNEKEPAPKRTEPPVRKRKLLPALIAAICAVSLGLGFWLGTSSGSSNPAETGGVETQELIADEMAESGEPVSDQFEWRPNVLKADDPESIYVYGTDKEKDLVKEVVFLDSLSNAPQYAKDVSVNHDGSVLMWIESMPNQNAHSDSDRRLVFAANGGINGREACASMFSSYDRLETVKFNDLFHTDEAEDMSMMFYQCKALTDVDMSSIDTSNVKDMSYMFFGCENLTDLDLRSFDTSDVADMTNMFGFCLSLTELKLGDQFTTENANTFNMFVYSPAQDDWSQLLN